MYKIFFILLMTTTAYSESVINVTDLLLDDINIAINNINETSYKVLANSLFYIPIYEKIIVRDVENNDQPCTSISITMEDNLYSIFYNDIIRNESMINEFNNIVPQRKIITQINKEFVKNNPFKIGLFPYRLYINTYVLSASNIIYQKTQSIENVNDFNKIEKYCTELK